MSVQLLAFDLDGTTLVDHKHLSARNKKALIAAGDKGVILVPATGRIKSFIPTNITTLPHVRYVITANGGGVYDLLENTCLHSACIPVETALATQAVLDDYQLYTEYYVGGNAYGIQCTPQEAVVRFGLPESKLYFLSKTYTYTNSFQTLLLETGALPEKINLPFVPPHYRAELSQRLRHIAGLSICSSIPDNMEINHHTATKGQGLKALCSKLGFDPANCMSIGDNGNDTDMLRLAGVSVAMGNASADALAAAKHQTLSCEQDGLALAIEQFIL